MARSGKAEPALYTCFISSFIGGLFGMMIMVLFTIPIAEFALKFHYEHHRYEPGYRRISIHIP
jgi:putative tricarboxylic transport membrane protein